ncbi:MAG TPA: hypothetical protein VFD11_03765 [Thiopseudomonas sp.]|nr:hypothetical protein [Thiopseudomonas sp.]
MNDCLELEGWLYSEVSAFSLSVEVNGGVIATFQPDYVRHDVCSVFPNMEQTRNTGFKLQIPINGEHFSCRGASDVKLYYVSSDIKQLLASSVVYHADSYPEFQTEASNVFYFTVASSNINLGGFGDFKEKLAPFAIGHCQLGFMVPVLYMRSTLGAEHDWQFDVDFDETRTQANGKLVLADSLRSILSYAAEQQIPCVIGLNGGIWGDAAGSCPEWDLTDHLEEEEINCQWNQRDEVMPDDYLKHLTGAESAPELSRALTLNHYNGTVRTYKKRNLQQAAQHIVEFAQQHPQLYLGSNLDPDCYHNPFFEGEQWYDFNPQTLQQFRHWLAATGVYEHELKHCIQHTPWSLQGLNQYLGTTYTDWSQVEPPRHLHCLPCSHGDAKALTLWEQFRRHLVHRHYTDLSSWLVAAGLPERMIFSSQGFTSPRGRIDPFALQLNSPLKNYDSGGMSLEGSKPEQGHVGAILYGESARNTIQTENQLPFFENVRQLDPDWAVVEFNPADLRDAAQALPSYGYAWECLREMFNHGARFVNLMAWNGSSGNDHGKPGFNAHMALRDTSLEQAVIDFMLLYADIARGEQCYTFGTQRYACLDGWSVSGGKLTPTEQGLQVDFIRKRIELYAPQPYLYSGASFIEVDCAGPVNSDLKIKLVVNGIAIDCEQHIQQLAAGDLSRYRLSIKHALPSEIAYLTLQVTAANAVKQLLLHRIAFKRKSSATVIN